MRDQVLFWSISKNLRCSRTHVGANQQAGDGIQLSRNVREGFRNFLLENGESRDLFVHTLRALEGDTPAGKPRRKAKVECLITKFFLSC